MLTIPINKNLNYTSFYGKTIPPKTTKIIDSELKNESMLVDMKIRDFLKNLINNKQPLSALKISTQMGLSLSALKNRINKNDELKALWQEIKSEIKEKSQNINNEIRLILEEFVKSQTPATIEDIAQKVGISKNVCESRIRENAELTALWHNVIKPPKYTKKEESQEIDNKIKEFIENAIANNLIILREDIGKAVNLSIVQVKGRIRNTPVLKELWSKLEHHRLPKNPDKEKNSMIKTILEQAIAENRKLSLDDIAEKTGFTKSTCQNRILKNPDIKDLWIKVRKNNSSIFGRTPTINNTAIQKSNSEIEQFLKNAIKNNTPVCIEDITRELNLTYLTLSGRFQRYPKLKDLWEQTPRKIVHNIPKTSIDKTEEVKKVLENTIKEKRSTTIKELAQEMGWEYSALIDKIRRTPTLNDLWKQIDKKRVSDDSVLVNENIADVLNQAINHKTYISARNIAKKAGISCQTCISRIYKTPELLNLWNKVQKIKETDTRILDNKIKNILENCIRSNNNITINDIESISGISHRTISHRLKQSDELKFLWKAIKNIETNILKQIYSLKKNNIASAEIKNILNLSGDKFADLNARYNKIKSSLLKKYGNDFPEEEILNWAFLSKREFELGINEIFSKMGYKSKTTRFSIDNGIDILAKKDGKTTIIECTHNLYTPTPLEEILALEGNKHYYNADNIIFVATFDTSSYGRKFAEEIGDNCKILTLKDIIALGKKYNINVHDLEEKGNINTPTVKYYNHIWHLPENSEPELIAQLKEMPTAQFEKTIIDLFASKGYAVKKADELNLDEYYLIKKGNKTSIIKCHNQNTTPSLDSIKALYGLKDFYKANEVILIGASNISSQSKNFIDKINSHKEIENTFKLYSIDKIINIQKKLNL